MSLRDFLPQIDQTGGFSLTELLVSLGILSLIAVLLATGLSFGLSTWQDSGDMSSEMYETRLVRTFLGEVLEQALPLRIEAPGTRAFVNFEGTADQVRFVGTLPERYGGRPLILEISQSDSGSLVLHWCRFWDLAQTSCDDNSTTILLGDVHNFRLSYFDGERQVWENSWERRDHLPSHIRVVFETSRGAAVGNFIVRPRITADPTCIYDPASGECRRA